MAIACDRENGKIEFGPTAVYADARGMKIAYNETAIQPMPDGT